MPLRKNAEDRAACVAMARQKVADQSAYVASMVVGDPRKPEARCALDALEISQLEAELEQETARKLP